MRELIEKVNKDNYLDFVSIIEVDIFNKIIEGLKRSTAISQDISITDFGQWLIRSQLDLVSGKMIFDLDKQKKLTKETIRTISLIQLNQSCELFYSNVDPKRFKPKWINDLLETQEDIKQETNKKNEVQNNTVNLKSINFIPKSSLNNTNSNKFDRETILTYDDKMLYYKLFKKLDDIYNTNSFFSRNKIFTLGDLMTYLFYVRQYKNMKCSRCFAKEKSSLYNKGVDSNKCEGCNIAKYFYCQIYSINEKYFHVQYLKFKRIFNSIDSLQKDEDFNSIIEKEKIYSFWNHVYLLLISFKPFQYLGFKQLQQYLIDIEKINFDNILKELFEQYKNFYNSFCKNISISQFQIMKQEKENIFIYYNIDENNKFQRGKLSQTYFIRFFEKATNSFFSLVRFTKSLGNQIIYHKNINPIFIENESINGKENQNNKRNISLEVIPNIGPFFYYNYLAQKLNEEFSEFQNNALCQRKDDIKCLKQGCLTLQMLQGFKIIDITTDKEDKVYEIQLYLNNNNNDDLTIDKICDICYRHNIKYKKLFSFNNKMYISFKHNTDCLQFSKYINQYLDIALIPKSSSNQDSFKLYAISFEPKVKINSIVNQMTNYLVNHNLRPVFVTQTPRNSNETIAYYCVNTETTSENIYKTLVGSVISNNVLFKINMKALRTYPDYENDFFKYLNDNYIEVTKLNFSRYFVIYKIENYTPNNRSLIDYYINETEMHLNNFALKEIKTRTQDTFIFQTNSENLRSFAIAHNVHIDTVYIDKKLIIYGAPTYRERVASIITDYIETLSKEKRVKLLHKEQILISKYIQKEALKKQFLILHDIKTNQIEYRDKYSKIINELIGKTKEAEDNDNIELVHCEICLEELNAIDKEINNVIQLRLCGHYFCVECLKMQIINQIKQGESDKGLYCIKCNLIIANSDIKEIFSLKEIEKLSYNLIKKWLHIKLK